MSRFTRTRSPAAPAPVPTARLELTRLEARENPAAWVANGWWWEAALYGANRGDVVVTGNRYTEVRTVGRFVNRQVSAWAEITTEYGTASLPSAPNTRVIVVGTGANDTIINNSSRPMSAFGGEGNDVLVGGWQADHLNGQGGNDTVYGGWGDDHLFGEEGNDLLWGEGGNDTVHGQNGRDHLHGGEGNDTLWGGADIDVFYGGTGRDPGLFDSWSWVVSGGWV